MAPTNYACTHQLAIYTTIDGFTHVYQIACNVDLSASPLMMNRFSMPDRLVSDCVDDFVLLYKALHPAATTITKYVVSEYNVGSFLPIFEDAIGVAGTHAGTYVKAAEVTLTFRDTDFKFYKPRILESSYNAGILKVAYPTTDAAIDPFILSHLPASAAADPLGQWVRSRGNRKIASVTFFTASFNKRLRRKRGI